MKSGAYLGVDIGGTNIKMATVSGTGRVRARGVLEMIPGERPRAAMRRIKVASAALLADQQELAGVGVGCAGLIDGATGRLRSSPNLPHWQKSRLSGIVRDTFGVYTIVENDANAAAWGEYLCGGWRNCTNFIFITLGTGVGGGIVSQGRLLKGAGGYGSEVGHITVDPEGPLCRCGNRGCLEAYLGAYGLVRSARTFLSQRRGRVLSRAREQRRKLSPRLIAQAARDGDGVARAVFKQAGERLGTAIASLVNVFNPEAVVLGGGTAGSFDLLEPHIKRTVMRRAFEEPARLVKIERSRLGNDAAVIGAAMLSRALPGRRRPLK